MAYLGLDTGKWGSGPPIPITFYYDYRRRGASMQYKIKIVIGTITGASYFGYPIYTTISLDGTSKISGHTLKNASPSQWSTNIVYETDWLEVSGKTTGTTSLVIRLYSGSGSSRDSSYSYALYVSPAATIPVVTGTPELGDSITINLPRADNSFTHTLTYRVGTEASYSGNIAAGATTTALWEIPLSIAGAWTTRNTGTVTIICNTYNGSTLIGTESINISVKIPDSVVPVILEVSIAEATQDIATKFGAYVQGKSTLSVDISATGAYRSWITKYETTILGVKYSGDYFVSQKLTSSGDVSVAITVRDSRGRTATKIVTIPVLAYQPPQIISMSAYRVNADGESADDGERVAINVSYTVASVNNKNTRLYSVKYRNSNMYSFTDIVTNQAAQTSYAGTLTYVNSPVISGDNAWVVQFELSDYFTTTSVTAEIPTAFTLMDFRSNGKGIAIGKVSEKDALEIAINVILTSNLIGQYLTGTWLQTTQASNLNSKPGKIAVLDGSGWVYYRTPAELLGDMDVKDYIVEQGSSSGWQYRKWHSGVAECWASATVSGMACTTKVGNWYRTGNITISNYPFTFTADPNLQMTFETYSGTGGLVWSAGTSSSSPKTEPATVFVIRPTSLNSITGFVRYYAKGKWK